MRRFSYLVIVVFGLSFLLAAQTVYITKSGKKYHSSNCSSLSKSKIEIDLSEAKDKGYTACSRCKPDKKNEGTSESKFKPEKKQQVKSKNNITTQQCEATTKKGTRCKRKAQTGSKYCWQHQN